MTVSQQRRVLSNSQCSTSQTKRGAMMNIGFRLLRRIDRCSQKWLLNQSVYQSKEATAERRARVAVFPSEFESAQLHIQIKPLFDSEPIWSCDSQSISCATEMNFERTDFLKVLK